MADNMWMSQQQSPIPIVDNLPLKDYLEMKEKMDTLSSQAELYHKHMCEMEIIIADIFGRAEGLTEAVMCGKITSKDLEIVIGDDIGKNEYIITIRVDKSKFYD